MAMVRNERRSDEATKPRRDESLSAETSERRNKMRMVNHSRKGSGKKARRGLAAVEFALVASLVFVLLIGLIDYGWIFLKMQQITQAARAGARAAVVADSTTATVATTIDAWMDEADIATFSYVMTPGDPSIEPGLPIKVEITVPTNQLALIRTSLIPVPPNLKAAASMAKEGT